MGLGWFIIRPKSNKKRMYRHGGNTGGYSSMMIVDVNNKNGIVLLSNVTAWSPYVQNINNLASALMKSLGNK
jgi:CubicO group peptidase (beta-lactamase class C family)